MQYNPYISACWTMKMNIVTTKKTIQHTFRIFEIFWIIYIFEFDLVRKLRWHFTKNIVFNNSHSLKMHLILGLGPNYVNQFLRILAQKFLLNCMVLEIISIWLQFFKTGRLHFKKPLIFQFFFLDYFVHSKKILLD